MEKQIIGHKTKIKLFDLTKEEKEVFITAVNKLSVNVYKRGETNSSIFLNAIDSNNVKDAMASFVKLSWKGIALKILHSVHAIHRIEDKTFVKDYIERIYRDAARYKEDDMQLVFKECPECGWLVEISNSVCDSCGALFGEV